MVVQLAFMLIFEMQAPTTENQWGCKAIVSVQTTPDRVQSVWKTIKRRVCRCTIAGWQCCRVGRTRPNLLSPSGGGYDLDCPFQDKTATLATSIILSRVLSGRLVTIRNALNGHWIKVKERHHHSGRDFTYSIQEQRQKCSIYHGEEPAPVKY